MVVTSSRIWIDRAWKIGEGRYVQSPTAAISNSDTYKNMNVLSYCSGSLESGEVLTEFKKKFRYG